MSGLFAQFPQPLVMRLLRSLGFNSLFALACTGRRGLDLAHMALLECGVVAWKVDGRDAGLVWRAMRRGIGCVRAAEDDFDGPEPVVKIVCVGDPGTGKTSFVRCFASGAEHFEQGAVLPVERPCVERVAVIAPDCPDMPLARLVLCDVPQEAELRRRMCYEGMHVALLFFVDRASLEGLSQWVEELGPLLEPGRAIVMRAKCDVTGEDESTLAADARQLAAELGGRYVECSATRASNIVLAVRLACKARFRTPPVNNRASARSSKKCTIQ
jgi:GTPase SAR1 family protein